MSGTPDWAVTTHEWAAPVDTDHLAHIRDNAATYARGGLRHLILEVLAYADEEAEATGRVATVVVTVRGDGSVSVADDGRGTDTRRTLEGRIIRKPVMSTRDVRFFDAPVRPLLPDGIPRWGISVVAALSTTLTHENRRTTGSWMQSYHHGVAATELLERAGASSTGTTVTFTPDDAVDTHEALQPADLSAFRSCASRSSASATDVRSSDDARSAA